MRIFRKFTLIELLITIAIIAILAGLLLPALGSARKKAYSIQCTGNLKQLGMGMSMYWNTYEEMLPNANVASPYWPYLFCRLKVITIPLVLCPSIPDDWYAKKWERNLWDTLSIEPYDATTHNTWAFVCYGYNSKLGGKKITQAKQPGKLVLFGDSKTGNSTQKLNCFRINDVADESNYYLYVPHGEWNESNVLHADTHARTYRSSKPFFEGVQILYAGPWKESEVWKIE